jgi:hypothetical protein
MGAVFLRLTPGGRGLIGIFSPKACGQPDKMSGQARSGLPSVGKRLVSVDNPMRVLLPLFVFLLSLAPAVRAAEPSDGAIRVLYLDVAGAELDAKAQLHDLMAALGRDAIWFD